MCALALSCGGSQNGGGSKQPDRSQITDFTLESVKGKTFTLSEHVGKKVILMDFWATWCEPCLAEMPHLDRIYQKHKAEGLLVVGIAMDGPESVAEVRAYTERNQLSFPVLLDQESRVVSLYNPRRAAPFSVIITRDGSIFKKRDGYVPGDENDVEADVQAALAAP
jgi:peroxiredoxin